MPVEDARLVDVPTRRIVNADVIRDGEWVFIRYTKPRHAVPDFSVCRIYKTEGWAFPLCIRSWPWQRSFMDVLVKLSLMTKERRDELVRIDRDRAEKNQREGDAEDLKRLAARYGLPELARAASVVNPTKEAA